MSLYDYLVLFPVFIGSLTSIVFYFLVKRIAGEAGGLFAALMIAVSPPLHREREPRVVQVRAPGHIPLRHLRLPLPDAPGQPMSTGRGSSARYSQGSLLGYANTAWGGAVYFTVAFGLFFIVLPFLNFDVSKPRHHRPVLHRWRHLRQRDLPKTGRRRSHEPRGTSRIIGGTLFLVVGQVDEGLGEAGRIQEDHGEGDARASRWRPSHSSASGRSPR